jgi:diguanylate cyclase (GGDEF)-like protein
MTPNDINNHIRILIVDDEESLRMVISQVLSEDGYDVTTAASGEEAWDLFARQPFHLVISDIVMREMNGLALLEKIKLHSSDTQVIIITSYASLDTAVTALRSGAYDYLLKPFEDLEVVSAAANRAVEKIRLIAEKKNLIARLQKKTEELEQANKVLKNLAIRDGLTGLYNHRYFQEDLAHELRRSDRYKRTFSLIFMDVDFFKQYNDTHGHTNGDELLRSLARILKDNFRKADLIARYGGDEFVALLPESAKAAARIAAEKMAGMVREHPFQGREDMPQGKVSLSVGVATFPEDGQDGSALIQQADQALYQAKKNGRDQVCVADNNLKNENETQTTAPHRPLKNDHVQPDTSLG